MPGQANLHAVLPRLALGEDVKQDLTTAVPGGLIALAPQRELTHSACWTGVGYILLDPRTGAGAYLINGGLNGGAEAQCLTSLSPQVAKALFTALSTILQASIETWIAGGDSAPAFDIAGGGATAALISEALSQFGGALPIASAVGSVISLFTTLRMLMIDLAFMPESTAPDCNCIVGPKPPECIAAEPPADNSTSLPPPAEPPQGCWDDTQQDWLLETLSHVHLVQRDHGDQLRFRWDEAGLQLLSIDKAGVIYTRAGASLWVHRTYRISRDGSGYVRQDKHGEWKRFDAEGRLLSRGAANGAHARILYGSEGRATGMADRRTRQVLWLEYDPSGNPAAASDASGRRVTYGYTQGRLSSVTDVSGHTRHYDYDSQGRLSRKTDAEGRTVTIGYGPDGYVSQVRDEEGNGHSLRFDFDGREHHARAQGPSGSVKEVWLDLKGETKRIALDGRTIKRIVKDAQAILVSDESGRVTRKELDAQRNLTRIVHPDGSSEAYEYEPRFNRRVKATDERGVVTQYAYDDAGNLVSKTEAVGTARERTTTYTYDAEELEINKTQFWNFLR